uniref:Putative secreted protein n=1 Tax=Ixodes ricinus TaxID=34613 RepID=A0A6B0U7D3_IXORI
MWRVMVLDLLVSILARRCFQAAGSLMEPPCSFRMTDLRPARGRCSHATTPGRSQTGCPVLSGSYATFSLARSNSALCCSERS